MTDNFWRPLGIEDDEEIAAYDALHDGVPEWMAGPFWEWVRESLTVIRTYRDGSGRLRMLNFDLAERLSQVLQIPLPVLRWTEATSSGESQLTTAIQALRKHPRPLQIADYLLAHSEKSGSHTKRLAELLDRSKSLYQVGERSGRPGLVERVEIAVKNNVDALMARSGQAGVKLSRAWELIYGIDPTPSEAYRNSIRAVEDAVIPIVAPNNQRATLGTVISQMRDQGNWHLPMQREHAEAPSSEVLLEMMRMLWHGQHDRHGGQVTGPGDVSLTEAKVAVSIAIALVQWFNDGLVQRS